MRDGWKVTTVGDVCEIVNGGTPKTNVAEYWGGRHSWITPAEMGKRASPYAAETVRKLTDSGLADCSARLLPPLSIILSSRAPIGHLVINTVPMATNQGCKGLVPRRSLNHKFLFYYLTSIVDHLNELGTGTTFKELSGGKLKEVSLLLPPLSEQKRIVAILDEATEGIDTAVANAERNLANARVLFERCMSSALASQRDTRTLTVRELVAAERGAIRTGPFGSQLLHGEFVDAGVAVLGIDNVVENRFTWGRRRYITAEKYESLRRYTVKPGDVLISIMGTCGRCAVVPNDIELAINSKHLCCISLDTNRCIPEYLHAYFLFHPFAREYLSKQSKGSIMDGLNMGIIQEMPVMVPTVVQQRAIAELLERARDTSNRLAAIQSQKVALLGDLRQEILRKAFAGELTAQSVEAVQEAAE